MIINAAQYYTPHPKQIEFHRAPQLIRLYGGAMGGGKSYAVCGEAVDLSMKYSGNRGVIIRKTLKRLKQTTLMTFLRVCPPELIRSFNRSDMVITLINGSTIEFLEADISKDPELNKLKGLEVGWAAIEEADEVDEKALRILATRVGRWVLPNGTRPPKRIMLTGNPEDSWVKRRFVDQKLKDHAFISALPTQNPHLPPGYITDLKNILTEDEWERYILGKWGTKDDPAQLIPYRCVKNATYETRPKVSGTQGLGVDVARYGDDLSIITHIYEYDSQVCLWNQQEFSKMDTHMLSGRVALYAVENRIPGNRIVVDGVGLGAGVVDNLRAQNFRVREFISGAKPRLQGATSFTYKNLRTQGYWRLRELFKDELIQIPDHQRLREDIAAHRYKVDGDKMITVIPKDDIKKRLNFSPDYSDALMMGLAHDLIGPGVISGAEAF
jgi:phage terminase large subunit